MELVGLEADLNEISVEVPDVLNVPPPESYASNNKKEELLLQFSENFQRQFRQLYSDRRPLLLTPLNEYGVPKFICSTMRPTYLEYKELYEYDGCAEFVADYLTYEPLEIPNETPNTLVSPTLVLKEQKGNCFDYAVLLASLLIGVGYDAYCVCGYASQDVCLLNLGRDPCPSVQEKDEVKSEEVEAAQNRYTVRPLRDFSSAFEKRLKSKELAKQKEDERRRKEEAAARLAEAEAPPPDKYHGLRVHCWVLILMGKRDVGQNFFIEPTTGVSHPLNWEHYHGIEVLWSHKNYWVNMQDCSQGVQGMSYDLGDAAMWEFFFPGVDKPLLIIPGEDMPLDKEDSDEMKGMDTKEDFQLPPSWVKPLYISPKDLESRCPKGTKTVLYYRAKEEKFAEYLNQDGLVSKFTLYSDTARKNRTEVRYLYKHRRDRLHKKVEKTQSGEVCEEFAPGRTRSLKAHTHYDSNPLKAGNRTLEFYSYARVDGLVKRVMTPTEMIEHYVDREDFLYYRHVTYEKPLKKHPPPEDRVRPRPILKVLDKYHADPALPRNQDMAERSFMMADNRILVVYQLEEGRNTASSREFIAPAMNPEQATILTFDPDNVLSYEVDPYLKLPKQRVLFEQLEELVQAREDTVQAIRKSENETEALLNARAEEEMNTLLDISVYDVVRNETARKHRQELEQRLAEEEKIRKEKEKDYLAPFLARIGDPEVLDRDQMVDVAQDCLKDLRTRLVDMANIIQGRFEEETDKLQKRQAWYKSMQGSLTKEEEGDFVTFCNDTMFTIHILEQRLNRHKLTAPEKYIALERRLKEDPRVCFIYK